MSFEFTFQNQHVNVEEKVPKENTKQFLKRLGGLLRPEAKLLTTSVIAAGVAVGSSLLLPKSLVILLFSEF